MIEAYLVLSLGQKLILTIPRTPFQPPAQRVSDQNEGLLGTIS